MKRLARGNVQALAFFKLLQQSDAPLLSLFVIEIVVAQLVRQGTVLALSLFGSLVFNYDSVRLLLHSGPLNLVIDIGHVMNLHLVLDLKPIHVGKVLVRLRIDRVSTQLRRVIVVHHEVLLSRLPLRRRLRLVHDHEPLVGQVLRDLDRQLGLLPAMARLQRRRLTVVHGPQVQKVIQLGPPKVMTLLGRRNLVG